MWCSVSAKPASSQILMLPNISALQSGFGQYYLISSVHVGRFLSHSVSKSRPAKREIPPDIAASCYRFHPCHYHDHLDYTPNVNSNLGCLCELLFVLHRSWNGTLDILLALRLVSSQNSTIINLKYLLSIVGFHRIQRPGHWWSALLWQYTTQSQRGATFSYGQPWKHHIVSNKV
jgi:hypothetical protein